MPQASDPLTPPRWSMPVPVDTAYASLQHIGNREFARLFDEARVAFNGVMVGMMHGEEHFTDQVIVRIELDFRRELLWRETLNVGVRVSRIGNTSYDLTLTIMGGDVVAVECRTVSVWMSEGCPVRINEEARAILASFA